jgi:hypothetical protein
LLLLAVAAVTVTIVASCGGGGGGSSNGGLCEQCGATDGPCQDTAFVMPGSGVRDAQPCPTASGNPNGCVKVELICRRKSDSAQQRCFPKSAMDPTNPDFNFRCDGSRPGGTAVPEPTRTLTPTPQNTPACGNGLIEGTEQCDTGNVGNDTCASVCGGGTGTLLCNLDCTLNVLGCSLQPCTP